MPDELPMPMPGWSDADYQRCARQIAGLSLSNAKEAVASRDLGAGIECLEDAVKSLRNIISLAEPSKQGFSRELSEDTEMLIDRSLGQSWAGHSGRSTHSKRRQKTRSWARDQAETEHSEPSGVQDYAQSLIEVLQRYQKRLSAMQTA